MLQHSECPKNGLDHHRIHLPERGENAGRAGHSSGSGKHRSEECFTVREFPILLHEAPTFCGARLAPAGPLCGPPEIARCGVSLRVKCNGGCGNDCDARIHEGDEVEFVEHVLVHVDCAPAPAPEARPVCLNQFREIALNGACSC